MDKIELRNSLSKLNLSQADFAKLLDVTPRGVSLWLSGERSVPGPAEAYLNLFASLSPEQRANEMRKLSSEGRKMKDGLYSLEFQGAQGSGLGVLIFDSGRVFGSDAGFGKYDGSYVMNPETGLADISLRVEMPANQPSVLGPPQPFSWNVDVSATIDPTKDVGEIVARTNLGNAVARYQFMRGLPSE